MRNYYCIIMEELGYLISNKVKGRYADLPYNLPYKEIEGEDVYSLLSFHYDNYLSEVKNYGFDGEDVCKGLKKAWELYEGSL